MSTDGGSVTTSVPILTHDGDMPDPALRTTPLEQPDGHPGWVARRLGRELSEGERALVSLVCAATALGPWNLGSWRSLRADFGGASVAVRDDPFATYDRDALTRLVILAHDRCLRVAVCQSGPGRLRISAHPRQREGAMHRRHPTMEQAIGLLRASCPPSEPR
jgi:hypothetical protein